MKGKIDFRIPIIIILTIILAVMCYFYFKEDTSTLSFESMKDRFNTEQLNNVKERQTTIVSSTGQVSSALTEEIDLHATYYLEESYVKTNELVKAGEKILKYTNGKYLKAPYDLVVTSIRIPESGEKCTNSHYVGISSNNNLKVELKVSETKINSISLGQKASITISAYEDKVLEGYVTDISNTASNGRFTVTVEFENDGEVMIGMTAVTSISE